MSFTSLSRSLPRTRRISVGKDKLCSSGGFGGGCVGEIIDIVELLAEVSIC